MGKSRFVLRIHRAAFTAFFANGLRFFFYLHCHPVFKDLLGVHDGLYPSG